MNWKKIVEQTVTVVLSMVLTGIGGAIVWGITTILQHERELATKSAQILLLQEAMKHTKDRDEELVTMMAEEIKKLKLAVEESCAHLAEEKEELKQLGPIKPQLPLELEKPKKIPESNSKFEKFFPPEQRTDDYQRILRDKFNQRTEQKIQTQQIEK